MPLSETVLLDMAGERVYARGEDYVRYVRGLRTTRMKAYASVQAKQVYTVELDWSGSRLDGHCTCRHHADGNFCKHLVAVGLAAIDTGRVQVDDPSAAMTDSALEAIVRAMDVDELRELVLELAMRDGAVRRVLEVRGAAVVGGDEPAKADFEVFVRKSLLLRGFVDYRESVGVAETASEVLDELEIFVDGGAADSVRPALRYALTILREIVEQSDDSAGVIGNQCQRAAELYALACRRGSPDPVELATWLVTFRAGSPGWPSVVLADFVDAFDERALAAYRSAVAELDGKLAGGDRFQRSEVDAMLLELADHDGDVDRTVELLCQRDHPEYGAIVDRLRAAGRAEDALTWIDRAVAAGRVTSRGGGNAYWLSADDVAETYRRLGRIDDAVAVLRTDFARQPSVQTYGVLRDFAAALGRADDERARAFDHARSLASDPYAAGALLVQLSLSEGDVDAAWEAADRYGAGWAWRELAVRGADARPVAAADLYRPQLEKDLRHPDTRLYPSIAETLATMAELYEQGGRSNDFAAFIAQIRHDYRRRPSLMKALAGKGL